MMKLKDALFSPFHAITTVLIGWMGAAIFACDAMGWLQPDYQRILAVLVITYWATVVCDLSVRRRRSFGS
ncbi:hypothetical protein [Sphingomonas koreensis]